MKVEIFVKMSIAALFLIIAYGIGYNNNNSKHYEAACLQADFIHSLMDWDDSIMYNPGTEIEELYYEWFQDLDCNIHNTKYLKSIHQMEEYSWCY